MAHPLARPAAASAARCSRRLHVPTLSTTQARHSSIARVEPKRMEDPSQWTDFQLKRAEYLTLSTRVMFPRIYTRLTDLRVVKSILSPSMAQLRHETTRSNPTIPSIDPLRLRTSPSLLSWLPAPTSDTLRNA